MRIKRLEIRRLPGIDQALSVDFEPSTVNLITGPNGSGKSSLVRAVRALLYPAPDDAYLDLSATWEDDEGPLTCRRNGAHVEWQRNGRAIPAPKLPDADNAGAFLISSEDLGGPGRTDEHIAAELRTLLTGGYDLETLLESGPFRPPPRPQKLARELDGLNRAISDKEAEYAGLHEDMQRLGRLESELRQAVQSAALISPIEDALALADALNRRSGLETSLIDEFPGGMDRLRGDELERLEQAQARLEQKQQAMVLEHSAIKQEQAELAQSGVNDPAELEALQSQLADARDALADTEHSLTAEREQIAQAEQALSQAARRLGSEQPEQVAQLDQSALETLERRVEKVLGLREKIRALSGQLVLSQTSRNPTGRPQDDLRGARSALQDWLSLARLTPLEGILWGSLGFAALLGSFRLISADSIGSNPELLLMMALAVGLPAGMLVRFLMRWRDREQAQERYIQTSIEPPLGWSESEVRARLRRLDVELEAAIQHEIQQARATELREQLNAQRASLERARDGLRETASELGISADPRLETGFMLWCRHLQDWQQQHSRLNEHRLKLESGRKRLSRQLEETGQLLLDHGLNAADLSARTLATIVHQMQPRLRRHAELHNGIQGRERRLAELQSDIVQIRHQMQAIYDSAGVKHNDLATLRHKCELFAVWQQLEQQRRELGQEISRLENRLGQQPELLDQARHQALRELEAMHQEAGQRAELRDELNRRIAEIRTRHADALKRRELQQLGATLEAVEERLLAELDTQMLAAAGTFLIEDVASTHRAEHEPAVLAAADQWLDRFTRHRYRLGFEHGTFVAIDTRSSRHHPLGELSTGSRAQLMLAVRLAWIEQLEQRSEALPVFMDEVLTTSDADRYQAVVSSVRALIDAGRQLFYLTAQSDDAQAWHAWLGDGLAPHHIDMAEIRRDHVRQLEFTMPEAGERKNRVPDPGELSWPDWARAAGIGPIDPWQDTGQVQLAHLLHDQASLAAELMRLDLERVGELERLLESLDDQQPGPSILTDDQGDQLARRCAAVRLILSDWRQRHRRPVDAAVLTQTGLLSDTFLPRVTSLAEQLGGDPVMLLRNLEQGAVPRFRSEVFEQLQRWLDERAYLAGGAGQPSLTAAELAARTGLDAELARSLIDWIRGAIENPLDP